MNEVADQDFADPADMTLDELRLHLAPEIAQSAVFDGWGEEALSIAADMAGVDLDVARLAFPGGAMDMIDAFVETVDLAMLEAFPAERIAALKVRDRIRELVLFRLDAVIGLEEAIRRASAIMALPQNAPRAVKIGWRTADRMWRLAGDTATDYNHYTKRAILSGVYASTLAIFLDDRSEEKADSRAFLDRRLANVMQFEKLKRGLVRPEAERFSVSRFLGRLRYPAR